MIGNKKNVKLGIAVLTLLSVGAIVASWLVFRDGQAGVKQISGTQVVDKANYKNLNIAMTTVDAALGNGVLEVPLDTIKEKKLVFYTYIHDGKKLPLMAYITPKGKLVTAVSMCEPCRSIKFHIEGNEMVCNTCGTRWDLESLQGISGGCLAYPPDVFLHTIQADKVRIKEADIAGWKPRI